MKDNNTSRLIRNPQGNACLLLLAVALTAELLFGRLLSEHFAIYESIYRLFHLVQMFVLILLVSYMRRHYIMQTKFENANRSFWLRYSNCILIALILSFTGDVINSHLLDLSDLVSPQIFLSILPFSLAHLVYIYAFREMTQWRRSRYRMFGGFHRVTLLLWPMLAVAMWLMVVDNAALSVLQLVSLLYALLVTLMVIMAAWMFAAWGRKTWFVMVGAMLFLLSDTLLGLYIEQGVGRPLWASQMIWICYFSAQCSFAMSVGLGLKSGKVPSSN